MNKVLEFIDTKTKSRHEFRSEKQIQKIMDKYGFLLPYEYIHFLLQFGGKFVHDNYYYKPIERTPLTPDDGLDDVDYFLGQDIIDNLLIF